MLPDQSDVEVLMPIMEEYASKCGVILELGCGLGNGSTRALIRGLEKSSHPTKCMISVDSEEDRPHEVPTVPWWFMIHGKTEDRMTAEKARTLLYSHCQRLTADLIYVDTEHTFEQIIKELWVWSMFSTDRTIWLFHDTWMFGVYNTMTDAIKQYAETFGWIYEDITKDSHGLGMMRKPL